MIQNSINRLQAWIDQNGWAGYDPYDVKDSMIYRMVRKTRYPRRALEQYVFNRYPLQSRQLLGVKKKTYAKAMGLFASSYFNLAQSDDSGMFLKNAEECLAWLKDNACPGYHGNCWAYPFDWYTRVLIPKGMPSGVVTSFVLDAFSRANNFYADTRYLEILHSGCNFFMKDLHLDNLGPEEACFSYTPIDRFHVHNANLLISTRLFQTGTQLGDDDFIAAAEKTLNYTLNAQQDDGSWYYWGKPDKLLFVIDNHHTGFNLQSLHSIYKVTKSQRVYRAIEKGLDYYLKHFINAQYLPSLYPDNSDHVQINACAEMIFCLADLSDLFPDCLGTAQKIAFWTIENMQDKKHGYFYYNQYHSTTSKMPYIRTGQAWMLRALSELSLRLPGESK